MDHEGHEIRSGPVGFVVRLLDPLYDPGGVRADGTGGMLMDLEDVNCWSLAEATDERGPHRSRHLMPCAVSDEEAGPRPTATWAAHPTCVSSARHCLIGRRLYLTRERAADEERPEPAGVPDELCFVTRPQRAADTLRAAGRQSMSASFPRRDEVYGEAGVANRLP